MEEETRKTNFNKPICPVCSAVRDNPEAERCDNCGADLWTMRTLENFTQTLLFEARNDIRQRQFESARTKLEIASTMDEKAAVTSRLIGAEIDVLNHQYDKALVIYKEIQESGFDSSLWGVDIESKITELGDIINIEFAAKEHYNLALHRSREGFFEEAREELYKASGLAPYLADTYLLAAKVDLSLGALSAVFDDLTRFRQLCPDDSRGINMQRELERQKYESRIQKDQILFVAGFVVFAIAVLIVIAFIK